MVSLLLSGCSSTKVKSTKITPLEAAQQEVSEELLLDVGVNLFDPGLDDVKETDISVYPEVRQAEARFFPIILMNTMQASANWGAVRVVPGDMAAVDVLVNGKILHSDGESLALLVNVKDVTGKQWFEKKYKKDTSKYSYQKSRGLAGDPFQDLYNRIANDIASYRNRLKPKELSNVRTVGELKFAQDFSPEAFGGHLEKNKKGIYEVQRLPSKQDPMLQRVNKIRERDYLFVDTLQDYYGSFSRQMDSPYFDWRAQSYEEVIALQELKRSSRMRTVGGIAAIIAGIVAAGGDGGSTRQAGVVSVLGGGYLIKSAIDKHKEAEIHAEALQELGSSLGAEIEPQVIDLDNRTVTLSGTVSDQYEQWRNILRDIYAEEIGDISTGDAGS
ncbi:MAG: hypothetical protein ACR2P1_11545 [Pseudomonadales bacterium]